MADEHTTNTSPVPKKRARTVSALTQDQVQHKRIVDRRAQRAFRQRTKDCIANLEQQFAELQETCSQKESELQVMRGERLSLMNFVKSIADLTASVVNQMSDSSRDQLATNVGHLVDATQLLTAQQNPENAQTEEQQRLSTFSDEVTQQSQPQTDSESEPELGPDPGPGPETEQIPEQMLHHGPEPEQESEPAHVPVTQYPGHDKPHGTTMPDYREPSHGRRHQYSRLWEGTGCSLDVAVSGGTVDNSHSTAISENHGQHHSTSNASPDVSSHFASLPTPSSTIIVDDTRRTRPKAAHAVLAPYVHPTCPLDEILLDFIHTRRELIAGGAAVETVLGPPKPTVKAMIDASLIPSMHPLSGVISGIFATFPHVRRAEKLGLFFKMSLMMRWQISPTRENYNAIPAWLRPTVTQVTVPHACWIDNIPWPGVRDILIEKADEYPFHVFSDYYSQNVTINWQYDSLDAISDMDGDCVLHSIFEKHVRNIKNWTVSPEFTARFPDMASAIYHQD